MSIIILIEKINYIKKSLFIENTEFIENHSGYSSNCLSFVGLSLFITSNFKSFLVYKNLKRNKVYK